MISSLSSIDCQLLKVRAIQLAVVAQKKRWNLCANSCTSSIIGNIYQKPEQGNNIPAITYKNRLNYFCKVKNTFSGFLVPGIGYRTVIYDILNMYRLLLDLD